MQWCKINDNYMSYLKSYEGRVPDFEYTQTDRITGIEIKKLKPFFGSLFEVDEMIYVTQVSSPKPRHEKMREQKDFKKINENEHSNKLLCVVNLNYMFPVPKSEFEFKSSSEISLYRDYASNNVRDRYIGILTKEIKQINKRDFGNSAKMIYDLKLNSPTDVISKRCFDFVDLETKAQIWQKVIKHVTDLKEDINKLNMNYEAALESNSLNDKIDQFSNQSDRNQTQLDSVNNDIDYKTVLQFSTQASNDFAWCEKTHNKLNNDIQKNKVSNNVME